jgi:hypothetical protein
VRVQVGEPGVMMHGDPGGAGQEWVRVGVPFVDAILCGRGSGCSAQRGCMDSCYECVDEGFTRVSVLLRAAARPGHWATYARSAAGTGGRARPC